MQRGRDPIEQSRDGVGEPLDGHAGAAGAGTLGDQDVDQQPDRGADRGLDHPVERVHACAAGGEDEHRADGHLEQVRAEPQGLTDQDRHEHDRGQAPPGEPDEQRRGDGDADTGQHAHDAPQRVGDRADEGHLHDQQSGQGRGDRLRIGRELLGDDVRRDRRDAQAQRSGEGRPSALANPAASVHQHLAEVGRHAPIVPGGDDTAIACPIVTIRRMPDDRTPRGSYRRPERGSIRGMTATKFLLDESEMPTRWYNVIPDLPEPPPPVLHPGTLQPVGPDDLAPLFPMELIQQEVTTDSYVDIPGPVLDVYRLWRPSPLYRAHRLEKALGTPAHIYYKYEGVSPAGSHKPNTAVPQAYYNAQAGIRRLTTETGAGQWGTALAFACAQFGLACEVWQVRASYDQKPYRKMMIEVFGGTIHPSPSDLTEAGRKILAEHPDSTGSLGIAISEAVEVAAQNPDTNYALGSVLNHVLLHQTIIGEEALLQMAKAGEQPDLIVGCTGGGSNFGGLAFPFLREKLAGRMAPTIRAVEPAACPSLTRGVYAYDFGDTAGMTPLMKMHSLGHDFIPDPIHAGGLRYHGMSPLISHLKELGLLEAIAKPQSECFAAGVQFARTEGIVPAPEPTHALAATIEEAQRCKESGEAKVILTALCGHAHLDLPAYDAYLSGKMVDRDLDAGALDAATPVTAAGCRRLGRLLRVRIVATMPRPSGAVPWLRSVTEPRR